MVIQSQIHLKSYRRSQWIDITSEVQKILTGSKISDGVCIVASLHTTAGITLNENADSDVGKDFFKMLEQLIPENALFDHVEGNSDSHIKASLVGLSAQVPFSDKRLVLGTWQAIYFCEFDGPRNRQVAITLIGE